MGEQVEKELEGLVHTADREKAQKVEAVLLDALEEVTGAARQDLAPFAARYGPILLVWGAKMKAAEAAGDVITAQELEIDMAEVVANAKMKAARVAILAQAGGEKVVETALSVAARMLLKFALVLVVALVLAFGAGASAQPAPGPVAIRDVGALKPVEKTPLVARPNTPKGLNSKQQVEVLRPQHGSDLVIEGRRFEGVRDAIAIKVNASSPDKPKVDGQVPTYRSVTIRRVFGRDLQRVAAGMHMDLIWTQGSSEPGILPDCLIEDVWGDDMGKGVMTILNDAGGAWGTYTVRRCVFTDNASPASFRGAIKTLVFEDCPGFRAVVQDPRIERVVVRDCPGAKIHRTDGGRPIEFVTTPKAEPKAPASETATPAPPATRPATEPAAPDDVIIIVDGVRYRLDELVLGGRRFRLVPVPGPAPSPVPK